MQASVQHKQPKLRGSQRTGFYTIDLCHRKSKVWSNLTIKGLEGREGRERGPEPYRVKQNNNEIPIWLAISVFRQFFCTFRVYVNGRRRNGT
jgi:hypothetical protein